MTGNRENDWVVSLMSNDLDLKGFSEAGLTTDNTQFKDKDYYKSKNFIINNQAFKNDKGEFDELAFDKFYDNAQKAWDYFSNDVYGDGDESELKAMERVYNNIFSGDSERIKTFDFKYEKIKNPLRQTTNRRGIGLVDDSALSISEIAQTNKVMDENGKTLDWTPNDKGGITGFWRDPLVLAQWDEDGTHEENGQIVEHKKGDYKYNEDGEICYEFLGNRDASRKNILSAWDTLTTDGSWANRYLDVWDADDKEQKVMKTIARSALKVAPIVLGSAFGGAIPALAMASKLYAGATAIGAFAESAPSVYKAIEGIVANNEDMDKKSGFWHMMNKLEAKAKGHRMGVSEQSQQDMFTLENFINLVPDVALQLSQQQLIAQVPGKIFSKNNPFRVAPNLSNVKSTSDIMSAIRNAEVASAAALNKFSRNTASVYMTITSGADMYRRAKEIGHDDRMAGIMTIGSMFGLYHIMRSEVGQWALKGMGMDEVSTLCKNAVKEAAEGFVPAVGGKVADAATKKSAFGVMKKVADKISNYLGKASVGPVTPLHGAMNEAIEEVSEEMVADLTVAAGAALSALGITRKDTKHDLTLDDMAARYFMSFTGGAIGGAIHKFKTPWSSVHNQQGQKLSKDLTDAVVEYGSDNVIDVIETMYKRGELPGSKNLKAEATYDSEGKNIAFLTADSEEQSQAWAIKELLKQEVKAEEKILIESGLSGNIDLDTMRALGGIDDSAVEALRNFSLDGIIKSNLKYNVAKIVDLEAQKKAVGIDEARINEIDRQINVYKLEQKHILDGSKAEKYVKMGVLSMNEDILNMFDNHSLKSFTLARTNKEFDDLAPNEQEIIKEQYAQYISANNASGYRLEGAVDVMDYIIKDTHEMRLRYNDKYNQVREQFRKHLGDAEKNILDLLKTGFATEEATTNLFSQFANGNIKNINSILKNLDVKGKSAEIAEYARGITALIQQLTQGGVALDGEIEEELKGVKTLFEQLAIKQAEMATRDEADYHINTFMAEQGNDFVANDVMDVINELNNLPEFEGNFLKKLITTDITDFKNMLTDEVRDKLANAFADDSMTVDEYIESMQEYFTEQVKDLDREEMLTEIDNALLNVETNPVFEYMNKISKRMDIDTQGIIKTLMDEGKSLSVQEVNQYFLSDPEKIDKILPVIENTAKIVNALSENPSGATYGQGYNYFISKLGLEEIPLVNANLAINMNKDLQNLYIKLKFLQELTRYNLGDKLREPKKAGARQIANQFDIYMKDSGIATSGTLMDVMSNLNIDLDYEALGLNAELIDAINQMKNQLQGAKVDDDLYYRAKKLITDFEHNLYKAIQEKIRNGTLTYDMLIDGLLNPDIINQKELYNIDSGNYSSEDVPLSGYDKVRHLMCVFTTSSLDVSSRILSILNAKNSSGDLVYKYALLPAQEYSVREAWAMLENPEVFNKLFEKFINPKTGRRDHEVAYNVAMISGYQGTGKTTATAGLLGLMLKEKYPDAKFTASSIVQRQTDNIAKEVNSNTKYNLSELLGKIWPGKQVEDILDGTVKRKGNLTEPGNDCPDIGKYIFLDEITLATAPEVRALTLWAKRTGRIIIGSGDYTQQGASDLGVKNFLNFNTPNLTHSMRSGATIVSDNQMSIRAMAVKTTNASLGGSGDPYTTLINSIPSVVLKYYNDQERGLIGHKIVSNEDGKAQAEGFIRDLIDNKHVKAKDIAIIYNDPANSLMLELKAKFGSTINILDAKSVQGGEFEYVVSLVDYKAPTSPESALGFSELFNTVNGRAKLGTLIVSDALINSSVKVKNEEAAFNNFLKFDNEVFSKHRDVVVKGFEDVVGTYKHLNGTVTPGTTPGGTNTGGTNTGGTNTGGHGAATTEEEFIITTTEGQAETPNNGEPKVSSNDGKIITSSTYINYGGSETVTKTHKDGSTRDFEFDVLAFLDEEGTFAGYEAEKDGEVTHEVAVMYDKMRITAALEARREGSTVESILAAIDQSLNDEYESYDGSTISELMTENGRKVRLAVFGEKFEKGRTGNNEINNQAQLRSQEGKNIYTLVLISEEEGPDGKVDPDSVTRIISLGEVYSNFTGDTKFNEVKRIADQEIEKNQYYIGYIEPGAISSYGSETRANVQQNTNRAYTISDLKNSNQFVVVSEPHIFTGIGKLRASQSEFEPDSDEYRANEKMVEEIFENSKIKGRPVIFVSKSPELAGREEELPSIYFQQLENAYKRKTDPSIPAMPWNVQLICLDSKKLTVNDFFSKFEEDLEEIKNNGTSKETVKNIATLAHKYAGIRMMKELSHYKRVLGGYFDLETYFKDKKTNKDAKLVDYFTGTLKNISGKTAEEIEEIKESLASDYNNVSSLLKTIKSLYGLGVWYDKKAKNYIVAYDRTDVFDNLTDPELKRKFKKVIGVNALSAELSLKATKKSLEDGNQQEVIDFYNSLGVKFLGDEKFSPSMILVEIFRHYTKEGRGGNAYNKKGINRAFTGNEYIGYEPHYYTADADGSVFEYHPVYNSSSNNHYTDFVEKAYVPDGHGDIFKIGRMIVTSQNLLVDFNNIQSREEVTIQANIEEEAKKQRVNDGFHTLSNLGIRPTPAMRTSLENGVSINDIIKDFKNTSEYENEYLRKGKILVYNSNTDTHNIMVLDGVGKAGTVITYEKTAGTIKVEDDKQTVVYDAKNGTERARIAKAPITEIKNTVTEFTKHEEDVQKFVESLSDVIYDPIVASNIRNILTGNYDKLSIPQLDGILKLLNPKQQEKFGEIMENLLKINNC